MKRRLVPGIAALIVVMLMLASSCASSDSSIGAGAEPSDGEATATEPIATEPATESVASEPATTDVAEEAASDVEAQPEPDEPTANQAFISPLGEALGFDPDDQLAANNAWVRSAEELVARCMAEAGFEYVPQNVGLARSFERRLELQAALTEQAFLEQYGYGIATLFELNFQDEGVLNFVEQLLGPAPPVERSPGEQEAYERALTGQVIQGLTADDAQQEILDELGPPAEGSCRQIGYDEADFPQGEVYDGLQSLLGDELRAMNESFEADSRVVDARKVWQRCMGEAGYGYETTDDVRDFIQGSANDLGDRFTQSPEALALFARALTENLAGMNETDRFDFLSKIGAMQGFSMVPSLQAELDALIDFELEVSSVSHGCADRDLYRDVRYEIEQQFVEAHADQLALIVNGEA